MTIQEMNLLVKHRSGKSNTNVDALSRNPIHVNSCKAVTVGESSTGDGGNPTNAQPSKPLESLCVSTDECSSSEGSPPADIHGSSRSGESISKPDSSVGCDDAVAVLNIKVSACKESIDVKDCDCMRKASQEIHELQMGDVPRERRATIV